MQVVVKRPRIRLEGDIPEELIDYLREEFEDVVVVEEEDEELIEVAESAWYRSFRPTVTPGENVRAYRKMHGLTQAELGLRIGNLNRQNISNIENGHRAISKAVAKRLAEYFGVSVEKFL